MNKRWDVYGIGNALVDFEVEIDEETLAVLGLEKGTMTLIDEARHDHLMHVLNGRWHGRACGGSAANSIIAVAQLGGKAFYSCRVADDEAGHFYIEDLRNNGVDTRFDGGAKSGVTGKCIVMITPDAERTMNTFLGITSELHPDIIDVEALASSRYLYIEGYLASSPSAIETVRHARAVAKENDVKIALSLSDPSMVQFFREGMQALIDSGVDLLFCNREEALRWTGANDLNDAVDALRMQAREIIVTLGADGALVITDEGVEKVSAYPVKAVDTNGAGDMFAGAFLYAITHGYSYSDAARLASYGSALVVSQFGPRLYGKPLAQLRAYPKGGQ